MDIVASVTINALMRKVVMISPLRTPEAAPVATPASTATRALSVSVSAMADATPAKATMDPTEMSRPPESMTNVSPAATIPTRATPTSRLLMLPAVRKYGDAKARMTQRTTSAVRTPRCSGGSSR